LTHYIEIQKKKKDNKITKNDLEELVTKINFFQHERLIHLIVTITYAIFTIIFLCLGMLSYIFLIIFAILLIFDIFYIIHYFFLENSVQFLYKIYDQFYLKIYSEKE